MNGWFDIDVEADASLVRLTMGGFFDADTIVRMGDAFAVALAGMRCDANAHVTLCDITAMSIQSQDMVGRFTELVGRPDIRSRRLAFVTGASLARLQARRLTSRPDVAFFSDRSAAAEWLKAA